MATKLEICSAKLRAEFKGDYPEDGALLDEHWLRQTLLTWRDNDRGARAADDPRSCTKNEYAAKAIAKTSFATTAETIKDAAKKYRSVRRQEAVSNRE